MISRAPIDIPLVHGRPDTRVTNPGWLEWFQRIFDERKKMPGLPVYTDNAAALLGGLFAGDTYRTATGQVMVVY